MYIQVRCILNAHASTRSDAQAPANADLTTYLVAGSMASAIIHQSLSYFNSAVPDECLHCCKSSQSLLHTGTCTNHLHARHRCFH